MKNLKLFNHWISEVRKLTSKRKLKKDVGTDGKSDIKKLSKSDIKYLFDKSSMYDSFKEGLTPKNALENELEYWE